MQRVESTMQPTPTHPSPTPPDLTPADLTRTLTIICRFLPPSFDREQLAIDILMESWLNSHPCPSPQFIHHRCIDALRHRAKERQVTTERALAQDRGFVEPSPHSCDELTKLTKCLTPLEKKIIALRFHMDMTVDETAHHTKLSPDALRLHIQRALYKMRKEAMRG